MDINFTPKAYRFILCKIKAEDIEIHTVGTGVVEVVSINSYGSQMTFRNAVSMYAYEHCLIEEIYDNMYRKIQ